LYSPNSLLKVAPSHQTPFCYCVGAAHNAPSPSHSSMYVVSHTYAALQKWTHQYYVIRCGIFNWYSSEKQAASRFVHRSSNRTKTGLMLRYATIERRDMTDTPVEVPVSLSGASLGLLFLQSNAGRGRQKPSPKRCEYYRSLRHRHSSTVWYVCMSLLNPV
jgi:hypothetical protein